MFVLVVFFLKEKSFSDSKYRNKIRFQDLKDERRRSQLSASRTILEKSTTLILTSSKVLTKREKKEYQKPVMIFFVQVLSSSCRMRSRSTVS